MDTYDVLGNQRELGKCRNDRVQYVENKAGCCRFPKECRRLEGHPLQVRHKQDCGQGFIL